MRRFVRPQDGVVLVLLTLWCGSLWTVGYLVAPSLFAQLATQRMLAGALTGTVLAWQAKLGIVCGLSILGLHRAYWQSYRRWLMLCGVMLLLTAIQLWGLQPWMTALKAAVAPQDVMHSVVAVTFSRLHGVSSVLHLLQSLLGVWALWWFLQLPPLPSRR